MNKQLCYQMEYEERISEDLVDLVFNSYVTAEGKLSIYGKEFELFGGRNTESYIQYLVDKGYSIKELNIYESILSETLDRTSFGLSI